MKTNKNIGIAVIAMLLVLGISGTALAASSDSIVAGGTGLGGNFDKQLALIGGAFVTLAKVTVLVMTAVAAMMVGWGIEDGKKTIWSWLLGAGLAINFGAFLTETGIVDMASSAGHGPSSPTFYSPDIKDDVKDMDVLSGFMDSYLNGVIKPGSQAILSPCLKLLLILTVLEVGWQMSFKLISGDKIKYLLSVIIKMGIFMFLMMNWIDLMGALGQGFQQIGFLAGGAGASGGVDLKPDSIYKNGFYIFKHVWDEFNCKSIGLLLLNLLSLAVVVVCMILTAIEMFMARIEFYTMALITIPLLPFIMLDKFAFLAEKAIGGMFNLAIKLSVISFITAMAIPFMQTFRTKMEATHDVWTQPALLFQAVLAAMVIYMLTKKIPEIVSSLINGQPSLSGGGMVDMAKGAANTAVGTVAGGVGAVRAASAINASDKGGWTGTLAQLGKSKLMSTTPVTRYRGAVKAMDDLRKNSGSRMLNNMRAGRSALEDKKSDTQNTSGENQNNTTQNAENFKRNMNTAS